MVDDWKLNFLRTLKVERCLEVDQQFVNQNEFISSDQ